MSRNVVGLVGGLGNQLFQYAFARWLERRTGLPTHLDLSAYRRRPDYLAVLDMPLRRLPVERKAGLLPHPLGRLPGWGVGLRRAMGPGRVVRESVDLRPPSAEDVGSPAWFYGYWQHPELVADVLDDLRQEVADRTRPVDPEPIAMHVRRGDMTDHASALEPSYFPRALDALLCANGLPAGTAVAVYSDDPAWCRRELRIRHARYVEPGDAAADLLALSRHEHLVLSGSTFSWWAAHLRSRRPHTVAAPSPFSGLPEQRLENADWLLVSRGAGDA